MPMLARTTNRQAGKQANRRTPKSRPLLLGRLRVQCRLEKGLLLWRNRHYLQLQKYPQNHLPQFPTRLDFLDSSLASARILPERAYYAHSSRTFPRDLVQATLLTRTRVFTQGFPLERFRVGYYRAQSRPIPRTREAPHKPLLPSLPFSPLLPLSRLPPSQPPHVLPLIPSSPLAHFLSSSHTYSTFRKTPSRTKTQWRACPVSRPPAVAVSTS